MNDDQEASKDLEKPHYRERPPRNGHKLCAQLEARLQELFKHDLELLRREPRPAKKFFEALILKD